jgi:hypothetical protein
MGAWTGAAIVRWLADLGIRPGGTVDASVDVGEAGVDVPAMPDRLALVYVVPAARQTLNGLLDMVGFQVRIRWDQGDPLGAETAALAADRLIQQAAGACPVWVGPPDDPVRLIFVERAAGRPTPLGTAPTLDGDRTTYVCTYLATVAEHD